MGQAQINVRTRACSRTSIARTRQAALTHNVRGKELNANSVKKQSINAKSEPSKCSGLAISRRRQNYAKIGVEFRPQG